MEAQTLGLGLGAALRGQLVQHGAQVEATRPRLHRTGVQGRDIQEGVEQLLAGIERAFQHVRRPPRRRGHRVVGKDGMKEAHGLERLAQIVAGGGQKARFRRHRLAGRGTHFVVGQPWTIHPDHYRLDSTCPGHGGKVQAHHVVHGGTNIQLHLVGNARVGHPLHDCGHARPVTALFQRRCRAVDIGRTGRHGRKLRQRKHQAWGFGSPAQVGGRRGRPAMMRGQGRPGHEIATTAERRNPLARTFALCVPALT